MANKIEKFFSTACVIIFTLCGILSTDSITKWICIGMCGINLFDLYDKSKQRRK